MEDNTEMDRKEVKYEITDWIRFVQNRDQRRAFLNADMKLQIPLKAGNFLISCATVDFPRTPWTQLVI
jgi:hypothetical protein